MIQGAVIRVIGVVLGLFVIFSVVSPVAGGLNELYLYSIASCNFGDDKNQERALKFIGPFDNASDAVPDDTLDWETATNVVTLKADGTQQTNGTCLLYTSPSPRDRQKSRMPSSA